jgi:hypothetical protein
MNGAQGGGYGQQYGQRSMPYGGSYGGGGMFGQQQGYGQRQNFGQNYGSAFGGQPRMQSQPPPQTGLPPWANQNVGGAQNPYSTVPSAGGFRMNPLGSGSGAGFNNFGQQPVTGGQNTVQDSSMPYKPPGFSMNTPMPTPTMGQPFRINDPSTYGWNKPMMLGQPQTGGQDYQTGGMDPYFSNAGMPNPQQPMPGPSSMANPQQSMPPPSWEQQNSQLLRPAQMQDPGQAQQTPLGSPTAQSQYPGLTPQQLAQVNWIGSNPIGGGHALNDYLLSIRYPGALQPGQQIR